VRERHVVDEGDAGAGIREGARGLGPAVTDRNDARIREGIEIPAPGVCCVRI
jgi:hypothetical protein